MGDWYSQTTHKTSTSPPSSLRSNSSPSPQKSSSLPFVSRRSPVICRNGCISTSQPLASSIGLQTFLKKPGSNAADVSIAIAAALCVLEPCSTGLGGDVFALHYDSEKNTVECTNGSGRAPSGLDLDSIRRAHPAVGENDGINKSSFLKSAHAVTVPGAARAWEAFLSKHGSGHWTMLELLEPAIRLAEDGFPVAPITAHHWCKGMEDIVRWYDDDNNNNNDDDNDDDNDCSHDDNDGVKVGEDNDTSLINDDDIKKKRRKRQKNIPLSPDGTGRGPLPGELMFNSDLANVLKSLGKHGAMDGFYRSWVGVSIANSIANAGGVMTYDDISNQSYSECTFPNPISVSYRGLKLWQAPPNGQGIAGLIALEGLKVLEARGGRYGDDDNNTFDNNNDGTDNINNNDNKPYGKARKDGKGWESANTLHSMIEMMRLGFADARSYVCDPDHPNANKSGKEHLSDYLLNPKRIADRVDAIFRQDQSISNETIEKYGMIPSDAPSGTVSFQVVDADGNAVSFVQSNFMGFGTGIVPEGCGFTMQNRGAGFSLDSKDHPNRPTPGKRPFHTILPGMLTHDDDEGGLYASISNMGGFMQPQVRYSIITLSIIIQHIFCLIFNAVFLNHLSFFLSSPSLP